MKRIKANSKKGGDFFIYILDVRTSEAERKAAERMVKSANGNNSKFTPAKYGYGPFGPKKY